MTNDTDDFLAHYGVKGMKWGVRKEIDAVGNVSLSNFAGTTVTSSKKTPIEAPEVQQIHAATQKLRKDLLSNERHISNLMAKVDAKYDPWELGTNPDEVRKYDNEISQELTRFAQTKAPKGAKALIIVDGSDMNLYIGTPKWFETAYKGEIYHADIGYKIRFKVLRDKSGFVNGFVDTGDSVPMKGEVKHMTDSKVADFLAHHGVKGMKWGVQKTPPTTHKPKITQIDSTPDATAHIKASFKNLKADVEVLNNSKQFRGQDLNHPKNAKLRDLYDDLVLGHLRDHLDKDPAGNLWSGGYDENGNMGFYRLAVLHSDGNACTIQVTRNDLGFITNLTLVEEEVKHMTEIDIDDFLAHHGIKGMRWGRRRSNQTLDANARERGDLPAEGSDSGGKKNHSARIGDKDVAVTREEAKALRKLKPGEMHQHIGEDGQIHTLIKTKDGGIRPTEISADADRTVATALKEGHEMSTREIKEAVARAEVIDKYNKLYAHNPNQELIDKYNQLDYQRKIANLEAELNPSKLKKVAGFVSTATPIFNNLAAIDKSTGGLLSGQMKQFHSSLKENKAENKESSGTNSQSRRAQRKAAEKARDDFFRRNGGTVTKTSPFGKKRGKFRVNPNSGPSGSGPVVPGIVVSSRPD